MSERPISWLIVALLLLALLGWWQMPSKSFSVDKSAGELKGHETNTVSDAFLAWTQQYKLAEERGRNDMLERGIAMARERRVWLAELIQSDPEAALAAALPRSVYAQLPEEIAEHMEEFVSMSAPLEVMQSCFHPNGCEHAHDHELYRSTVIGGREVFVHVYGSRLDDFSIPKTSLHGIMIDDHFAVSESRVHVIEAGEPLPEDGRHVLPGEVMVVANGQVIALPSMAEVELLEASLRSAENNPAHIASDSGDGTSTLSNRIAESWSTGDKKLLVIMVDFDDLQGRPVQNSGSGILAKDAPVTEDAIHELINGTNGVRQFYQDSSFGRTDLLLTPPVAGDSPDVTEVLRMPQTASYYSNTGGPGALGADARAKAITANYNLDHYDRVCVFFTNLTNFGGGDKFNGWGGKASVGGASSYINGNLDFRVVAHEFGHNWGLKHANLWKVTDGNPGSLTTGISQAYGDSHDTMGAASGSHTKHFSQWAKSLLWWLPDAAVPVAQTSGVYRVHRFDGIGADLNLARALKIVRDETRDYWIGYRREGTTPSLDNGAYVLWGYNSRSDEGDLLDMNTPGTDVNDAGLAINQTYEDVAVGIEFTPIAQGGSGANEWLDIEVVFKPRISWAVTEVTAGENWGYATLRVNRTRNDSGTVTVDYTTNPDTAFTPSDYTTTSGTLTWQDGDSAPKFIQVPLVQDGAPEATESFTITLSSAVGGILEGSATATATITDDVPTVYASWSGEGFSQPFSLTGPTENPDGDRFNNLQEFAFGMDPTHPDTSRLSFILNGDVTQAGSPAFMNFASQGEAADYHAVFLRRKDFAMAGLLYSVDFSADLTQWTTNTTPPTVLTRNDSSGNMEAVSVPYPTAVPANGGSENLVPQFFRVGVSQP